MYNHYFQLKHAPFSIAPDPRYLFMSERHREALAHLLYGIGSGGGFVLLTGEIGAGKTTVCRCFIEQIPDNCRLAYIFNPRLNVEELLQTICDELHIALPSGVSGVKSYVDAINRYLLESHAQGLNNVLVIDEAQNLNARTVEELRMLSNFQTDDRSLLQTFLLGQPEFRATLHSPTMQQLRQRVIASYHLGPMDAQETRAYVEHRLATVGWKGDPSFDDAAHAAIYAYSGGIPRKTNTLMDRVLLMGYLEELHGFGGAHIEEVVRDISDEFQAPDGLGEPEPASMRATSGQHELQHGERRSASVEQLDERMMRLEKSIVSVLSILKKIAATPPGAAPRHVDNQE